MVNTRKRRRGETGVSKPEPVNSGQSHSSSNANTINNSMNSSIGRLAKEFYNQECLTLARGLLGKVLVHALPDGTLLKGVITETEGYPGGDDAASQSYNGRRTERNEPMYMTPGTSYVYFTYGSCHCFNISSKGDGSAVLIRALQPLEDYEFMHSQRITKKQKMNLENGGELKRLRVWELCNGPGKICFSMDIRRDNCNKLDLSCSELMWLERSEDAEYSEDGFTIESSKRIGIDNTPEEARNKPWRFYIEDNYSVSRAKISEIKKKLALNQK